jgi:hypothetical protein
MYHQILQSPSDLINSAIFSVYSYLIRRHLKQVAMAYSWAGRTKVGNEELHTVKPHCRIAS